MDGNDVARYLYAEFGQKEFLTRQISDGTMVGLARMMGIVDVGQSRRIKVGQYISNLEGAELIPSSGQKVKLAVIRPENRHLPRRFQFVATSWTDAEPPAGVGEITETEAVKFETTYEVVLIQSGDSYAAICPALRGCQSQGGDEAEALENIKEAIAGWLKAEARDVQRRTRTMLDDYRSAGFPVKLDVVGVGRLTV